MKLYINPKKCKTFRGKSHKVQRLINHTLYILDCFGIPIDGTDRRIEKIAMAFLACGDIKSIDDFKNAKDSNSDYALTTRQIIRFINPNFGENISSGSYDDIRRKDLKLLTIGDIVSHSIPKSAKNDSTRGYVLNPFYAYMVRSYGTEGWKKDVKKQLQDIESLEVKLKRQRDILQVPVTLPSGKKLDFSIGKHNELQKAIIEEFLPRYGYGGEVLYVGDTANKYLHLNKEVLQDLNFFDISHDELPDVISYSKSKNWLYLIEAVHSSGPIDELRILQFKKLTKKCKAEIVYVTAFLDRKTFKQFMKDIAWETEVWIANHPDHLIHFNGDKHLGPYVHP